MGTVEHHGKDCSSLQLVVRERPSAYVWVLGCQGKDELRKHSSSWSSWDGLKADYKFMHLSQLKAISNCIHLQVQFLYVTESHIVLLCLLGNNSPAHSAKWLADLIAPLCILTCLLFSLQSSDSPELSVPPVPPAPVGKADAGLPAPVPPTATSGLDDLDLLGKTLLQQSLPPESQQVRW